MDASAWLYPQREGASLAGGGLNVPDEEVGAYRACYLTGTSDTFTPDGLLASSGALQDGKVLEAPPALRGRVGAIRKTCGREPL